jgi:hypothetical protein
LLQSYRAASSKGYFRAVIHLLIDLIGLMVLLCIGGLLLFFTLGIIYILIDEFLNIREWEKK